MHENIIQNFDQFLLQSRSTTPFPCQPRWLRSWELPRLVYRGRYGSVEGRDSSVGIATRHGLDGSGTESGGGEVFRTRPDRPWGLPSLLYNRYRVFPGGKAAGTWRWPPTPSSAEVKERAELYFYSHSGPSWPVLGWTFYLYVLWVGICRLVSHGQCFMH